MATSSGSKAGGVGFLGLLAIVFITLRLLDKIDWSWWWVLAPIWGPLALAALVVVILLLAGVLAWILENKWK